MMNENTGRRRFLQTAGIVGAFTILKPHLVRGSAANSAVRVGLLGCGNRGSTDANNIITNTDARLVALADLFQDQIDKAKQKFPSAALTFVGPDASRQIVESKELDAVIIATPAYFHPEHLAAAVAAGKHVYCEKPVAVDVPGTTSVLASGKSAEGRLSLDVGFQIRSAPPFMELMKRIHEGALGDIAAGEAHYYCPQPVRREWPAASDRTLRLRNWITDRVLSGDIIVEQDVHVIDICNWALQGHPLKAVGRGSRMGRGDKFDDCYSHFDVVFEYAGDVPVSFNSTQFGKGPFEASERFFGTRGAAQSPYSGPLGIVGDQPWTWAGSDKQQGAQFSASGSFSDNLAQADSEKQKAFIASITSGKFHNQAAGGVESALSAMLGRQAAYTGREMTWDELIGSNEHWDAGIDVHNLA
jgi:predicted dehydrogenase